MYAGLLASCCVDAKILRQLSSILFVFEFFRVKILFFLNSMGENNVVIDISSDEENLVEESFDISEQWVNELLESVDVEVLEDLDDVMIADEISTKFCLKRSSALQKEFDDDCLILDGDPDKVVNESDGNSESVDGCAELVIIGEKGHLACRDYPHPRHLCVSFPFSSTPHEKHCKLCHCYVCDSLAPCIYWGFGLSTADHCHASEKEQHWKSLRNYFKLVCTQVSEPPKFLGSRQSNTQPFRSSQDMNKIPDPSTQRQHQLLCSSRHLIGSQSFPTSHYSQRAPPVPNYFGSSSHESSGLHSRDRLNSNQPHRISALANSQLIQPQVSNNIEIIRGVLASIEADLLGSDYNNGSMEESNNKPSASTLYPVLSKTSVIGEAQARI